MSYDLSRSASRATQQRKQWDWVLPGKGPLVTRGNFTPSEQRLHINALELLGCWYTAIFGAYTILKPTVFPGTHGPRWNGTWIAFYSNALKAFGDVNWASICSLAVITPKLLFTIAGITIAMLLAWTASITTGTGTGRKQSMPILQFLIFTFFIYIKREKGDKR